MSNDCQHTNWESIADPDDPNTILMYRCTGCGLTRPA